MKVPFGCDHVMDAIIVNDRRLVGTHFLDYLRLALSYSAVNRLRFALSDHHTLRVTAPSPIVRLQTPLGRATHKPEQSTVCHMRYKAGFMLQDFWSGPRRREQPED